MDDITASIIVTCQTAGAAASIDKLNYSFAMIGKQIAQFAIDSVGVFRKTQDAAWKFGKTFANSMGSADVAVREFMKSYNLSEQTARTMLTDTAQVLKGMGFAEKEALQLSESVSRWGIDLASFTGYAGGAKGAVEAITASMLGENERLKGLGIVIREDSEEYKNLVKSIAAQKGVTEQTAAAYAKLELITQKAADAKGDYMAEGENFTQSINNLNEQWLQVKSNVGGTIYEVLGLNDVIGGIGETLKNINEKWQKYGSEWTLALRSVWIDVKAAFDLVYVLTLKPFFVTLGTGFENIHSIIMWFSDNWGKAWKNAGDIGIAVLKDLWEGFKWMFGLKSPIVSLIVHLCKAIAAGIKAAFTPEVDVKGAFMAELGGYVREQTQMLASQGKHTAEALQKAGVSAFPKLKSVEYDFGKEIDSVLEDQKQSKENALNKYLKSLETPVDKNIDLSGSDSAVGNIKAAFDGIQKDLFSYRKTVQDAITSKSAEGIALQSRVFMNTNVSMTDNPAKQTAANTKRMLGEISALKSEIRSLKSAMTTGGIKLAKASTHKY